MGINGYPRLIRATKTYGVSSRALLANMFSCTPGCAPISPTAADKASVMLQVRRLSLRLIYGCRHCRCPLLHPHQLSHSQTRMYVHLYMNIHTASDGTLRLDRRCRRAIQTGYTPFPYRTRVDSTHACTPLYPRTQASSHALTNLPSYTRMYTRLRYPRPRGAV